MTTVSEHPASEADELRRLREQVQWQPIETAPKDATPILAWRAPWVFPQVMCWLNGQCIQPGWHCYTKSAQGREPYSPTHWVPLPSPPEAR